MNIKAIEDALLEFAKKHRLRDKAMEVLTQSLDESHTSKGSIEISHFGGFQKSELKFEFERYELHLETEYKCSIFLTRIGIYVHDPTGIWHNKLEPIGYYILEVDLEGEVFDDHLIIEKSKIKN